MTRGSLERATRIVIVAVAVAYCLVAAAIVIAQGSTPPDAVTYLAAGERLNAGHPLYVLMPGDRVISTGVEGLPYPLLSPPAIAVVWRPLAGLGAWTITPWWMAGAALYTAALAIVLWRAWPTALIVLIVVEGIAWLIAFGNVQTYLGAGIVLLWAVRDRPWGAALVAVTMAAVKLTPIPLVLWVARDRRSWIPIAACGLAWLAACELLAPGSIEAYLSVARAGGGATNWPVAILGTAATVVLPRRAGFAIAVATSVLGSALIQWHWLAMLPLALVPWDLTTAVRYGPTAVKSAELV